VKFSKDGKFIKTWGKKGSAPGEIDIPHALAMDSRGRIFLGDRNNRIQIFDQGDRRLSNTASPPCGHQSQFSRVAPCWVGGNCPASGFPTTNISHFHKTEPRLGAGLCLYVVRWIDSVLGASPQRAKRRQGS
jgi:hypothetical protein